MNILAVTGFKLLTIVQLFLYILKLYLDWHQLSVTELGNLLTRSGLTYPEVSSKVCHDSFCQLANSVSLF